MDIASAKAQRPKLEARLIMQALPAGWIVDLRKNKCNSANLTSPVTEVWIWCRGKPTSFI